MAASAETIFGALTKAYQFNSSLNSARAGARVTDEGVAIAKSGYRPTIAGQSSIDYTSQSGRSNARITTGSFGIQISQNIFDGFQTRNNVAAAEAQVRASFESLRNTEENTLFDAASAYMDVIRDRQIAILTEQNLQFLAEQSRAARSRLEVGEGTRTDVAQADASRSSAVARLSVGARAGARQRCDLPSDRRRGSGQAEGCVAAHASFCPRASNAPMRWRKPTIRRSSPASISSMPPASR